MTEVLVPDSVPTLHGSVRVGDIVAIGVQDGNSGGIRMGAVVAIKRKLNWDSKPEFRWNPRTQNYDIPIYSVQVKVTISSEYTKPEVLAVAKPRWYGTDNMVRVG